MTQPPPDISFVSSRWDSIAGAHRFSHSAMATVFEIIIIHKDTQYARQAAQAAFEELDKLEQQLSQFVENSDISQINNLPANQPLVLGLPAFECIQLGISLYERTGGAFDITVGSLMDCWLGGDKTLLTPSEEKLQQARRRTGSHLIKLDETGHTIQLLDGPVQIDLGGIAKGYAINKMAELLNEWSIETALINGGSSSVLAIGAPDNTKGWHITLSTPPDYEQVLANLYLCDRAVAGSGLLKGLHIINPHTAEPAKGGKAAWAFAPAAAVADALSTAFMIMSRDRIERYCSSHPDTSAMVVSEKDEIFRYGSWSRAILPKS
jgi:thiamine biosynthesis lipoprotein